MKTMEKIKRNEFFAALGGVEKQAATGNGTEVQPSQEGARVLLEAYPPACYGKEILTAEEVCAYLGITPKYLNYMTYQGLITFYKPNKRHRYFKRADVMAYALQNKQESR